MEFAHELPGRAWELLTHGWALVVLAGAWGGAAVAHRGDDEGATWARWWWGPVAAVGAARVFAQASLFDDAFVTFRYIDQWMQGHGLVYNIGEWVQGYSNPLWLGLVALGHVLTGAEIPLVALGWNLAAYVVLVALAARASRHHGGHPHLPLAAMLLAVQQSITAYATTGMETLLGAALVLGAFSAMRAEGERPGARWALVGTLLALGIVHRLDHTVFWVAGLAAAATRATSSPPAQALRTLGAYLAPLGLVVGHLSATYWLYGDVLPNTYYAKASAAWRPDQGLLYIATFVLSSGSWLLAPLAAWWVARGPVASRPARVFLTLSAGAWALYLLKIGGDFMFARFCLPVFPAILVAAEAGAVGLATHLRRARPSMTWVPLAALGATLGGLPVVPGGGHFWGQADESSIYPLVGLNPVHVDHSSWFTGRFFREVLTDRGLTVHLGACCIGMVGYYSRQPLLDFHGLTDAEIARLPVASRRLTGHEKKASPEHIRERGVAIARWGDRDPKHLRSAARLRFPAGRRMRYRS